MAFKLGFRLNRLYFLALLVSDFIVIAISILLAVLIRFGSLNTTAVPVTAMMGTWIFFSLTELLFMMVEDLYTVRTTVNRIMNIFRTTRLIIISSMLYVVALFLIHFPSHIFLSSRISVLLFVGFWLIFSILMRIIVIPNIFPLLLRMFRFGTISLVLFGPEEVTVTIRSLLLKSPVFRNILKLRIHRSPLPDNPVERLKVCREIMEEDGSTEFIMVFEDEDFNFIAEFCLHTGNIGIPFSIYSERIPELGYFDPWISLGDYGALTFFARKWTNTTERLWRINDILLSIAGLILLTPVFIAIALTISLTSPGGVLFKQTRIGRNHKQFIFLKFRSMLIGAKSREESHKEYFREYVNGSAAEKTKSGKVFKKISSDSVTTIGRIIRRTSLDELPQIFNVLKGDMSIVGPRPCINYELEHYNSNWLKKRFTIKPGLTGIWQVYARSRLGFKKSQFLDFVYVISRSDGINIRLILKTFPVMFLSRGGI
ncbi:MAG: sugar transferase [Candidatus Fermentibacteraceae bacterium]|nr:sugar transferase [Candidatus Fermentibacteraceae bacterium]